MWTRGAMRHLAPLCVILVQRCWRVLQPQPSGWMRQQKDVALYILQVSLKQPNSTAASNVRADETDKNLVSPSLHDSSLIHPEHSGCNIRYPVHKSQLLDSLLSQLNPMHTLTHNVSYVFNIILHPSLGLPNDSFPSFFNKYFLCIPKFQEVWSGMVQAF